MSTTTQQPVALPAPLEYRLTIRWSEISSSTYRGKSREECTAQLRHLLDRDLIGISRDPGGVFQLTYRTPDKMDEAVYPAIGQGHPDYHLVEQFYARIAGDGVHWSIATAELTGRPHVELSLQTYDNQQIRLSGVDRDDCIAQLRACIATFSEEQIRGLWFGLRRGEMVYITTEVREGQTMYPYALCRYYRAAQPPDTPSFLWKQPTITTDMVLIGADQIAPVIDGFIAEIGQDGKHWTQLGPQPHRVFIWTEADKRLSVAAVGTSITEARPRAIAELQQRLAEHEDRAGDLQILMESVEVNLADIVLTPGEDNARVAGL